MGPFVALLFAAMGVAGASYLVKVRQSRRLTNLTDDQFVRIYQQTYTDPPGSVLEMRRFVARHLSLRAEILAPGQTFEQLAKFTGFAGEYEVGMGDLESELIERFERARLAPPKVFPHTVGEFIHKMLSANQ